MRCARMGTGTEGRRRRGRARRRCRSRGCELVREFLSGVQRLLAALVESRGVDVRIVIARAAVGLVPENGGEARLETFWYLLRGASDASERPVEGVAGSDPAVSCCRNAAPLACFLRLYSSRRFLPLSRSLALRSMATARTAGPSGRAGWSRPRVRSTNARICRWEREPLGSHARSRSPRARASPTMARSRPSRRTRSRSMTEAGRSMSRSRASPGSGAPRAGCNGRTRLSEPLL